MRVEKGEGRLWCISRSDWSSDPTKKKQPFKSEKIVWQLRVEKLDRLKAEEAEKAQVVQKRMRAWRRRKRLVAAEKRLSDF